MIKWKELCDKISDDYTIYESNLVKDMALPAIIFTPSVQTPEVELSNYRNRILNYKYDMVFLVKLADYDTMLEAMDYVWEMAEQVPDLLGVKIMEWSPFGHYMGNEQVVCIQLKVISKI
jgi:hypothetical protein